MAFAVSSGTGYSKFTVRFPSPEQALAEARDQVEHGNQNVTIRIAATGEEFSVDEFTRKIDGGDEGARRD